MATSATTCIFRVFGAVSCKDEVQILTIKVLIDICLYRHFSLLEFCCLDA